MKKVTLIITLVACATLLMFPDLEARGGGGRGGGGGGHGGGRSVQRSPSMSRAASRPAQRPESRPAVNPRPQTRVNPSDTRRQNTTPRPVERRPVDRGEDPRESSRHRPIRSDQRPVTLPADRQNLGNNIRNQVRENHPNRGNWFNNNFWDHSHYHHPYYNHHDDWWKWGTAVGVGAWLGWNSSPIYYDYYNNDGAYYWGPSAPPPAPVVYVDQTQVINQVADQQTSDDWMPLGVFAISKPSETIVAPNRYVQLAINKSGIISGTYYNSTTDQSFEVVGSVDPNTQLASWRVVDDPNSPIIETGIYNLTQSEAPVHVHLADGRTLDMLLTRVEK